MIDDRLRAASEAARLWVNAAALAADLAAGGGTQDVIAQVLSTLSRGLEEHGETLAGSAVAFAGVADAPVRWGHGRGLSGVARQPGTATCPHAWPSATEAAMGIAELAVDLLSGREGEALANAGRAMRMDLGEVADLQVQIRRERAKLEAAAPAVPAEAVGTAEPFLFSSDYSSCRWGGEVFTFTVAQRGVLKALHEEYRRGTYVLSDETLCAASGGAVPSGEEAPRALRDLFRPNGKPHPAWGALIVQGPRRGTRVLAGPAAG